MKIIITESQINKITTSINEVSGASRLLARPLVHLRNLSRSLLSGPINSVLTNLSKTNTVSGASWETIFNKLITKKKFTSAIVTKPSQLSVLLRKGKLSVDDVVLIHKTIINNSIDKDTMENIARHILSSDTAFRNTFKNKTKYQIKSILRKKGYRGKSIDILTKEILNKSNYVIPTGFWKNLKEYQKSPKLYELFYKNSVDGQSRIKILSKWLLTGTTRKNLRNQLKQVVLSFKDSGLTLEGSKDLIKLLVSFSTEAILRWMTLNVALSAIDFTITYIKEQGTEEWERRKDSGVIKLILKDFFEHFKTTPFGWVLPFRTVIPAVGEIVSGLFYRRTPAQIFNQMMNRTLPEQKELESLNNEFNEAIDNPELDGQIEEIFRSDEVSKIKKIPSIENRLEEIKPIFPDAEIVTRLTGKFVSVIINNESEYLFNTNNKYYKFKVSDNSLSETGNYKISDDLKSVEVKPEKKDSYERITK
jgi:hypothetical protein